MDEMTSFDEAAKCPHTEGMNFSPRGVIDPLIGKSWNAKKVETCKMVYIQLVLTI